MNTIELSQSECSCSRSKLAVLCLLTFTLAFPSSLLSQDVTFPKTKQVYQEGEKSKERDVALAFLDTELILRHRKDDRVFATIPYDSVTELTYELSKNARIAEAILLSPLFLLSSSKKHWLTIKYQSGGESNFVLLQLDKKEYQQAVATAEIRTRKAVARVLEN